MLAQYEEKMKKTIESLEKEYSTIQTTMVRTSLSTSRS